MNPLILFTNECRLIVIDMCGINNNTSCSFVCIYEWLCRHINKSRKCHDITERVYRFQWFACSESLNENHKEFLSMRNGNVSKIKKRNFCISWHFIYRSKRIFSCVDEWMETLQLHDNYPKVDYQMAAHNNNTAEQSESNKDRYYIISSNQETRCSLSV